jgi:hypothetical protein
LALAAVRLAKAERALFGCILQRSGGVLAKPQLSERSFMTIGSIRELLQARCKPWTATDGQIQIAFLSRANGACRISHSGAQ